MIRSTAPRSQDEFVAVRDEPDGPFYLAKTLRINATTTEVHHCGCSTTPNGAFVLSRAKFLPCWHLPGSNDVVLALAAPNNTVAHTGSIDIDSLQQLLVARSLLFTSARKLRAKSRRVLEPKVDLLFLF